MNKKEKREARRKEREESLQELLKREKVPLEELSSDEIDIIRRNRNPIAGCGQDCLHCLGWVINLCWHFEEYREELNQEDEEET